jgi:hypothetical protein
MLNPGAAEEDNHGRQPGDLTAAQAAEPADETLPDLPADKVEVEVDEVEEKVPPGATEEIVDEYIEE